MDRIRTTWLLAVTVATPLLAAPPSPVPDLARRQPYTAGRVSSADPTGGNKDNITIPPGQTVTLADLKGPGLIAHCWFTMMTDSPDYLSKVVLQIRWDDADAPAVDVPWGPFFGLGHDECADVVSEPIVVMAGHAQYIQYPPGLAAFNCYFPMPFRKRAVIGIVNRDDQPVKHFFYHIDYQQHAELPDDAYYFHATYRTDHPAPATRPESRNTTGQDNYVILETAGQGHYVGCTLHVNAPPDEKGKWYEGDDLIVVDGRPFSDAIRGTGSEDYFGLAWGVRRHFQSPQFGTSYHRWPAEGPEMLQYGRFSLYRWHLRDPIPFTRSIHVSIEHGHDNDAANRYASTAYWYAAKP
ncbi:MAG: hypothetical protein AMXMBFR13_06600 [Phycisphaerae bacterium]